MKQTYPYWRRIDGGGWAFYTRPRHYTATCMRTAYGQWRVPHLNHAGPFDRLEDAQALVMHCWEAAKETAFDPA
jgi:hypothetical protein